MSSPVAELLADLSRALEVLGLRWYVFGAQAALLYGSGRLTTDVDITVGAPPNSRTPGWLPVFQQHGFASRVSDPQFIEQTRVLPLVHSRTSMPVDLVLGGPGLEEEFLVRAAVRDIDGVGVPVIDLADLLALKILAGRPKDIDDVGALLHIQRASIDYARVRHVLTQLQDALGQSDLLPAFEDAVRRAG